MKSHDRLLLHLCSIFVMAFLVVFFINPGGHCHLNLILDSVLYSQSNKKVLLISCFCSYLWLFEFIFFKDANDSRGHSAPWISQTFISVIHAYSTVGCRSFLDEKHRLCQPLPPGAGTEWRSEWWCRWETERRRKVNWFCWPSVHKGGGGLEMAHLRLNSKTKDLQTLIGSDHMSY